MQIGTRQGKIPPLRLTAVLQTNFIFFMLLTLDEIHHETATASSTQATSQYSVGLDFLAGRSSPLHRAYKQTKFGDGGDK